MLNDVTSLVDECGFTICDKRRLQELLGPVGNTKTNTKTNPIRVDLVPVQGADHEWVWSAVAGQAGAEFGRHCMCSQDGYRLGMGRWVQGGQQGSKGRGWGACATGRERGAGATGCRRSS